MEQLDKAPNSVAMVQLLLAALELVMDSEPDGAAVHCNIHARPVLERRAAWDPNTDEEHKRKQELWSDWKQWKAAKVKRKATPA